MSPERTRIFCWTCGGENGRHYPDCDQAVEITLNPPKEPPPHCGKRPRGMIQPVLDYSKSEASKEPQLHYCCRCNQPFVSTFKQWLEGPCPRCGAKGA